jgi:hypothetical protein
MLDWQQINKRVRRKNPSLRSRIKLFRRMGDDQSMGEETQLHLNIDIYNELCKPQELDCSNVHSLWVHFEFHNESGIERQAFLLRSVETVSGITDQRLSH